MDSGLVTGLFTLGGVLVGGVLQGATAAYSHHRLDSRRARKAARIFGPCLNRCGLAIEHAGSFETTWGELVGVIESNLARWPEHEETFADTLHWDQWFPIYAAVRSLQQLVFLSPDDPAALVGPDYTEHLEQAVDGSVEGWVVAAGIAYSGSGRQRLRRLGRRLYSRVRPNAYDKQIDALVGDDVGRDSIRHYPPPPPPDASYREG
jgi:hypothetical protein